MSRRGDHETDFTVYDGRRHVLGASMLAAMDEALRNEGGVDGTEPFHIKRAKFMRKTECNGLLHTAWDGARPAAIEGTAAHVVGRLGARTAEAWFVPDENSPVSSARPSAHDISEVAPAGDYAGSCRVSAEGLEQVLCILIDANKLVQLAGQGVHQRFGDAPPVTELVYLEDFTIDTELTRLETKVALETLGVRENAGRLYSLNRLCFTGATGEARQCRVGFSFEAKSET